MPKDLRARSMTRSNICGWCGRRTERKNVNGACAGCQSIQISARPTPTYKHALTGGEWVNDRGVQRWVLLADSQPSGAACGTDSGYFRHRRFLREKACGDCRAAHAEAERRRVA